MNTPPDRESEAYAKEREEMRAKSDGDLRRIAATSGNPYTKGLAEEELQDRRYAQNAQEDRRIAQEAADAAKEAAKIADRALFVSIIAAVISVIALFF